MNLADLTNSARVLAANMKHIHLYAVGENFDEIHAFAEEYYEKATKQADTIAELAIEKGHKVENALLLLQTNKGIQVEKETSYNYKKACAVCATAIKAYLQVLEEVGYFYTGEEIHTLLTKYLLYWNKELNYKLAARMS